MQLYLKVCKGCNEKFTVNKWQKGKLYCSDDCKRPEPRVPRGSPRDPWREIFDKYGIQTPLGTTGSYSTNFNLSQGENA